MTIAPAFYRALGEEWLLTIAAQDPAGQPFDFDANALVPYADLFTSYRVTPVNLENFDIDDASNVSFLIARDVTQLATADVLVVGGALLQKQKFPNRLQFYTIDEFGVKRTAGVFSIGAYDPRDIDTVARNTFADQSNTVVLPTGTSPFELICPVGTIGYARSGYF